jgi:hypothetical protein
MNNPGYMVILTEYESGWGSRVFDAKIYPSYQDALNRVKEVNAENDKPTAPDYYITADLISDPALFDNYKRFL